MALLFAMLLNVPPALDSSERPLNAVRKLVYTATKSALFQAQASDCVPVRLDQAALLILLQLRELAGSGLKIEIPYERHTLSGCFGLPEGQGPLPTVILYNGLDSIKEMTDGSAGDEAVKRGVAVLFIDQEGTGESICLYFTTKPVEFEKAASAFIDCLGQHPLVDNDRISVIGCSNGVYDAPRAAILEPRLKLDVSFSAFYHGDSLRPLLKDVLADPNCPRRGLDVVDQMKTVMGKQDSRQTSDAWCMPTLEGLFPKLNCPYHVVHGENDRLVPLRDAERSHKEAINSPRAELKAFSTGEGNSELCGVDLIASMTQYMFG